MNRKEVMLLLKRLTTDELFLLKEELKLEEQYRESILNSVDFFISLFVKHFEEKGIICYIDSQDIEKELN